MFSQIIDQQEHKNNWYKFGGATWCCKPHSKYQIQIQIFQQNSSSQIGFKLDHFLLQSDCFRVTDPQVFPYLLAATDKVKLVLKPDHFLLQSHCFRVTAISFSSTYKVKLALKPGHFQSKTCAHQGYCQKLGLSANCQ